MPLKCRSQEFQGVPPRAHRQHSIADTKRVKHVLLGISIGMMTESAMIIISRTETFLEPVASINMVAMVEAGQK